MSAILPIYPIDMELNHDSKTLYIHRLQARENTGKYLIVVPDTITDGEDIVNTGLVSKMQIVIPDSTGFKQVFLRNLEEMVGHSVLEPFVAKVDGKKMNVSYEPDFNRYISLIDELRK